MARDRRVRIDALPESALRYLGHTVVYIDVISACTTLVGSVAQGRRTFTAASVAEALRLHRTIPDALLAGAAPPGSPGPEFASSQSPAALEGRSDRRPLVLLDLPGTRLIASCDGNREVWLACLRNLTATANHLAERGDSDGEVVLLGAAEGDDFRCEDRLAAARIGKALLARGFEPVGQNTADLIERWGTAPIELLAWGRSAQQLRRQGRSEDLEFVWGHVDDLELVCGYDEGEVLAVGRPRPVRARENAAV